MKRTMQYGMYRRGLFGGVLVIILSMFCPAQEVPAVQSNRDSIIAAARDIIGQLHYVCLITIDSAGVPQARTMNPFPPEEDMSVWMATDSRSEKIREIRNNPNVCLYYANHAAVEGYVTITGKAQLVDDTAEKMKRKREYWSQAFPDFKYLLLIKIVPERLEVVNYKKKMYGATTGWAAPSIIFPKP